MATAGRIDVSPLPKYDPVIRSVLVRPALDSMKRRFETYILAVSVTNDA